MGGGTLQLVMTGFQDLYITYQPQITFFKQVYKQYSSFAIESIPQNFNVLPDFGTRVTCTISKNADLIAKTYLVVEIPPIGTFSDYSGDSTGSGNSNIAQCAWVEKIGFQLIKTVELEIAGQIIDRQYGDWMNIWSELSTPISKVDGLNKMIGNVSNLTKFTNGKSGYLLWIPLMFYFCRNPSLAFPLVALENADVKINVEFNSIDDCLTLAPSHYILINEDMVYMQPNDLIMQMVNNIIYYARFVYYDILNKRFYYTKITPEAFNQNYTIQSVKNNYIVTPVDIERLYLDKNRYFPQILGLSLTSAILMVDYIYLQPEERVRFARNDHTYIIDTIQFDNEKILYHAHNKIKLAYTNPCKEIIFRGNYDYFNSGYSNDKFNYTNAPSDVMQLSLIKNLQFLLNGQERVKLTENTYYEWLQIFTNHTKMNTIGIGCYSFALKPEDSMITGSCNFSKMDDIVLQVTIDKGVSYTRPIKIRVYAVILNIMKLTNGLIELIT
jgi:hypothetical protein